MSFRTRGSTVGARNSEYRNRDVAQFGSAPCSGRGGRKFESCHPDFVCLLFKDYGTRLHLVRLLEKERLRYFSECLIRFRKARISPTTAYHPDFN